MTSSDTLELLEKLEENMENKSGENNSHWFLHSKCVGDSAAIIAEHLGLDIDKARVLGYIHDIGVPLGEYIDHVMNGYNYIKELGFGEEYANICLTHSFLNNDVNCTAGGIPRKNPFLEEFIKNHEYNIYEKIINLCDLMCTSENITVEERLEDLKARKGIHENTAYHENETMKLKELFDNLIGFDIYCLFWKTKKITSKKTKTLSVFGFD